MFQHQPGQRLIQQRHRIGGRHAAIIHVAGDEDDIRFRVFRHDDKFVQKSRLLFGQRLTEKQASQVPIRCMDHSHVQSSGNLFRLRGRRIRRLFEIPHLLPGIPGHFQDPFLVLGLWIADDPGKIRQ